MATRVYGRSDDLIEFDGDVAGEVSSYAGDDVDQSARGDLIVCSDGTLLIVKYGKGGRGIWSVTLLRKGSLLVEIEQCDDEDADPYSDVATFADGLIWAYAAKDWERVK